MTDFSGNIKGWGDKAWLSTEQAIRGTKLALFAQVILATRVRFGRLKGNWQTTTGSPAIGESGRVDPTGEAAILEAAQKVTSDGVDYLTNNLPYAEKWEEEDGMIRRSVARIKRSLDEQARKHGR